jgi:predicted nucleic acid-binding protein
MAIAPVLPETPLALDTDVLTDWRKRFLPATQNIIDYIAIHKRPPALTTINIYESLYGFENKAVKEGKPDERTIQDRLETEKLIRQCSFLPSGSAPSGILPFDQTAAIIAAYIMARLSKSDQNKHSNDVFIAATALSHRHGIATRNRKDFELIANHLPSSHQLLRLAIWK